ncbi:hypothetical protein ACFX1Z_028919 [Malus domestica]
MGSDGFFDNILHHEIVSIVAGYRDVAEAAKALANWANNHSLVQTLILPTPWRLDQG